jgi:hypothetical protein
MPSGEATIRFLLYRSSSRLFVVGPQSRTTKAFEEDHFLGCALLWRLPETILQLPILNQWEKYKPHTPVWELPFWGVDSAYRCASSAL